MPDPALVFLGALGAAAVGAVGTLVGVRVQLGHADKVRKEQWKREDEAFTADRIRAANNESLKETFAFAMAMLDFAKRQGLERTNEPLPNQYKYLLVDPWLLRDADLFGRWATVASKAEQRVFPTTTEERDAIDGLAGALSRVYLDQRELIANGQTPEKLDPSMTKTALDAVEEGSAG